MAPQSRPAAALQPWVVRSLHRGRSPVEPTGETGCIKRIDFKTLHISAKAERADDDVFAMKEKF